MLPQMAFPECVSSYNKVDLHMHVGHGCSETLHLLLFQSFYYLMARFLSSCPRTNTMYNLLCSYLVL